MLLKIGSTVWLNPEAVTSVCTMPGGTLTITFDGGPAIVVDPMYGIEQEDVAQAINAALVGEDWRMN